MRAIGGLWIGKIPFEAKAVEIFAQNYLSGAPIQSTQIAAYVIFINKIHHNFRHASLFHVQYGTSSTASRVFCYIVLMYIETQRDILLIYHCKKPHDQPLSDTSTGNATIVTKRMKKVLPMAVAPIKTQPNLNTGNILKKKQNYE